MSTADALYTADDLTALEGLDAVRKRPGMYIGSTDSRGMTHLVYEIIDNSVDEALAGHCTTINITLHPDGSVEVTDNGRGIPTDINTKTGLSGIELVLTKLHAGGKFGGSGYKSAGGLHGVGSSVVNALSTRLDATVLRNGKHHKLSFQRGTPGQFTGTTPTSTFTPGNTLTITPAKHKTATGTTIRFWPDSQVFLTDAHIDTDAVTARAQQTAFLVPGLTLTLTLPDHDTQTFHYDGGVVDMVEFLAPDTAVCDPIVITGTGTYDETVPMLNSDGHMVNTTITRTVELTAALRWGTGYDTRIESFVNVVRTPYGGSHKKAFEKALTKTLNDALKNTRGLLKPGDEPPTLDDITEGLTAVISVNVPEPQFVGQTKDELGTAGVTKPITHLVTTATKHWLDDRRKKTQVRTILEKIAAATKVRQQQRAAKEAARRKTALEGASMPAKLVDCRSTGVDRSELFIVEGDSALGCFTGDTLVATAEGRPLTFAQLAQDWAKGIVHFGYATNKAGDVNVAPLIEPRVTKTAHTLVRVTLDNGESVRCTPDHLFRLRDGSYLRADELQPGQSLMPLYRKDSAKRLGDKLNGYEQLLMNTRGDWVYTHYLADAWNTRHGHDSRDNGIVRHHVDFNRRNNHPANIKRMTHEDHFALHAAAWGPHVQEGHRRWRDEEGGRELLSANMKAQWQDEEFYRLCAEASKARHRDPAFREVIHGGFRRWYQGLSDEAKTAYAQRLRDVQEEYWSDPANREAQAERTRQFFDDPANREAARQRAVTQWANPDARAAASKRMTERFSDHEEREAQRGKVLAWHVEHPEFGQEHSARMTVLMRDPDSAHVKALRDGRRRYNEQVPFEERARRVKDGRRIAALARLTPHLHLNDDQLVVAYETERLANHPTSLRFASLIDYYGNDSAQVREAAATINHKVSSVEAITATEEVYDLTVEGYHNFALEAGVFVHNSARGGRYSEYQALLPIRGKILNVQKASLKQVLDNAECASIIQVVGAGSGRTFDVDQMRYGRLIVMADADVDGAHIRVLLITLVYRYMRPIIEEGRLFAAMPPLHKITVKGKGGDVMYTYTQAEMEETVARLEAAGKSVVSPVPRYKGLGEMNASELWETTMDPTTRSVRRITLADAEAAEATLELLLGNKVEPRREFLIANSDRVDREDLDV